MCYAKIEIWIGCSVTGQVVCAFFFFFFFFFFYIHALVSISPLHCKSDISGLISLDPDI